MPEQGPAPVRVLFVCLGNICRSPTAEAMLRRQVRDAGLADRVEIDSAGTLDYHAGAPPDPRAVAHGERRGLALRDLRARQVCAADFDRFDTIFAMDAANLVELERLRPRGARARLALLMDCVPEAGVREVPDPYSGDARAFERVLDLVDIACARYVATLREQLARDA
jgi:protein-tyrosine phosphatase